MDAKWIVTKPSWFARYKLAGIGAVPLLLPFWGVTLSPLKHRLQNMTTLRKSSFNQNQNQFKEREIHSLNRSLKLTSPDKLKRRTSK